jgi:hypothetical protein
LRKILNLKPENCGISRVSSVTLRKSGGTSAEQRIPTSGGVTEETRAEERRRGAGRAGHRQVSTKGLLAALRVLCHCLSGRLIETQETGAGTPRPFIGFEGGPHA